MILNIQTSVPRFNRSYKVHFTSVDHLAEQPYSTYHISERFDGVFVSAMFSSGVSTDQLFDAEFCAQDLRSKISHTFTTGFMSDIEFTVGEGDKVKSYQSHRFILGINSAVFHAMFYGTLAEVGTKVCMKYYSTI